MLKFDRSFLGELKESWLLLTVAFCCLLFGMSAGAFSMPFVYPEVIKEFGWTREQATLLATVKYAITAISALAVGRLIDSIGVWPALVGTTSLSAIALTSYLWVSDLNSYYLTGILLGCASGGGIVSVKVLVSKAFHNSQGTAMGIALLGIALGGTLIPIIITALISALGWRYGFAILSLAVWFITLPLIVAGYLSPARRKAAKTQAARADEETNKDFAPEVRALFAKKNFWLIAVAVFGAATVDTAFGQHQVLIFRDLNFSASATAYAVSMIGLAGIISRVIVGNILDRASNKGLAVLYLTMSIASVAALALLNPIVLFVFIILRAVGHSTVLLDTTVMSKHAFGNSRNMGTLLGLFTAFSSAGFAFGPWIMGRMFDTMGTYRPAYFVFALLPILLMVLALRIRPDYWLKINRKQ
ncbi:MAG: MFS transporter [Parasphingorhabdus sp.]